MSKELSDLRLWAEDMELVSRIYCALVLEENPDKAVIGKYIWKVIDTSKNLLDAAWAYDRSIDGEKPK